MSSPFFSAFNPEQLRCARLGWHSPGPALEGSLDFVLMFTFI